MGGGGGGGGSLTGKLEVVALTLSRSSPLPVQSP